MFWPNLAGQNSPMEDEVDGSLAWRGQARLQGETYGDSQGTRDNQAFDERSSFNAQISRM